MIVVSYLDGGWRLGVGDGREMEGEALAEPSSGTGAMDRGPEFGGDGAYSLAPLGEGHGDGP